MNGSEKNNSGSQFMTVVGKLGLKNKSLSKKKTADSLLQANKLEIWTVDNKIIPVDLNRIRLTKGKETDVLVRDVVRDACRQLNIYPKTSTFFGLSNENNWLIQTKRIDTINSKYWNKLVLTLQFKVLSSNELRKFDETAYLYYVKQCRYIFKNGLLQRQLESRENEKILLRMVILEMMMVAKEENVLPLKDVLKSKNKKIFNLDEIVKKYNDVQGPRDVSKCKQKVEKSLNCFSKVAEPDKDFVTEVELLSHYREEIFHIKKYEGERKDNPNNIELWITPTKIMKRAIIGNVKMTLWESPYEMFHRFKDITDDKTDSKKGKRIMVLRGREPPEMMYCYSDDQVESLFSFVDGYFQLLVNQYDTLLNEMLTSNILTKHVYHGPIEREVALQILTSKGREPGTYLLREHTTQHDCFVLSLIREDDTFAHVVIRQKIDDNKVIFNIDDKRKFQDLNELQEFYKNPDNSAEIKACLQKGLSPKIVVKVPMYTDPVNFRPPPPSRKNHIEINSSISPCLLDSNRMELKHLKNGAFGDVFKSEAQISDERREVIVKRYPTLKSDMLNDVATLLMQIQDDLRILPFVGMSVTGDLFLAFEYLPLGSLEKFLELNRSQVTYGGLLKYLLQITEAVTYLHTKNLIHADLRLSKFFMKDPKTIKLSDCCITWKLSTFKKLDERIFQKRYKHLAPEIFLQQNQLFTQKTDVWAFGLTMWQLFTLVRPFKNYTSTQLMTFFREHMKMNEEPSLNYLNMNILFFCPDKLLNVFTKSLHTREDKRCNMIEIQQAVIDLHRKTPTIHKEKSYFLHDWESEMKQKPVQPPVDPSYYADSAGSLATTNDGGNTTDGSFSDAYTINEGLTSARSDVSNVQEMNGAGYIAKSSRPVLDESSDKESDGDLISPVRPKNADTSSTTDGTTTATVSDEQASSTLDNKSTVDDAESPYLTMSTAGSPSDLVTPAMPVTSKTDERMDVDVTSLTSKDTTLTASSASLPRHGMSRSAPSSPSRPRIFRATSANSNEDSGGDKRGEQDLETASILVDMSQTKLAHKGGEGSTPQGKRPLPNHHLPPGHPSQKQAVLCVPQGYSIVGRVGAPISGQPVRFFNPPPQHPHRSHHFQDGVKRSKALQRPPIKQPPIAPPPQNDDSPLSPPPPPPDSPDSSRRDYSDPPKREIPRDDKTRLFLQEKINKERDRFRGKRSISFNEEFDEYKNSTRKAAKRALLSANPFNLGIKVPDNFLMRPEKRLHPQTKSISAGVMKFFASSLDEKAVKENEQQLINGKSPSKNPSQYESPYRSIADIEIQRNQRYPPGQPPPGTVPLPPNSASQHNPALDPYKTSEDLRKYRESALMKPNEEMNRKPEMQTIVQGIQDMHAHSPKDLSYEENRLPANRPPERRMYASESIRPDLSATSTMTTTTINGFLQAHPHGISSIFMPVQQVRFPYGHPTDPSQSPYQLPPSSTLVTRPVTNGKKITSGVAAIYPPPGNYQILPAMHVQTHGDRTRPIIMAANPPPHVRPRIQPAQPTLHSGKYPSVPPNLQRFDSRVSPGIYTTDHPRMPVSDSHAPYTALQNIRSSESSQIGYQKLDPSNVPKLDNVISFGNKSATTIPAPQPIVKKEPVDSDYSPSMNRTEKQGSDYSSNMNRTEKQGPLSPAGLFSPTEPKLFQPNVHKPVLKKHISRINLKFDRKKDLIGKGQFGVVYKAKWMFADPSTKQKKEVDVAVKTLHEDNPLTDEAMDDLRKEADAMAILTSESLTENEGSKHILKMYGVCDDHKSPKKFSIITERAQGGALDTYLYKNKASLGDNGFGYCLFYARQIAIGMEYLHSLNLIHRDLACRNILVMDRELVKISDFGLSRIFTDSEYYRTTKDKKLPFHWMAIETIGNLKYTKETDYWSYGVLLWEALTVLDKDFQRPKVLPYKEIPNDELHSYLDKGNRLAKPKGCPDKLYNDIMLKCWDRDPQQRPTFYRSNKALKDLMDEINFCVGQ